MNATDIGYGPIFMRQNLPYGASLVAKPADGDWRILRPVSPVPIKLRGHEQLWVEFRGALLAAQKKDMPHACFCGPLSCLTMSCWVRAKEKSFKVSLREFVDKWAPRWAEVGVTLTYFDHTGTYSYRIVTFGPILPSAKMATGRIEMYGVKFEVGAVAAQQ